MVREIKFRAKRIDGCNNWVYGSLIKDKESSWIVSSFERKNNSIDIIVHEVIPETVGQYTGLKDKDGKEIYEGDNVKVPDDYDTWGMNAGNIHEIYFKDGGFRFKPIYNKNARGCWLEDDGELLVISNIHENKEQLEDSK